MKPFRQILTLIVASVLGLIIFTCLSLALNNIGLDTESLDVIRVLQGVGQVLMFLLPSLAVVLYSGEKVGKFYRFHLTFRAILGAVAMLLLIPLNDVLMRWNGAFHLPEALHGVEEALHAAADSSQALTEQLLMVGDVGHVLLNVLILAVVPAVCEELFFRGTLQTIFRRWFSNSHIAIIVTAAVFSMAHGDMFNFLPRFMLGIVLGYLYEGSCNLFVCMAAHFINNAVIVVLYALFVNNIVPNSPMDLPSVDVVWTVVATVGAVLLIYQTHRAAYIIKK